MTDFFNIFVERLWRTVKHEHVYPMEPTAKSSESQTFV